jgi:GAF domain-containing protein
VHVPCVRDDPEYVYPGPYEYRALDLVGVAILVRREPRAFSDAHVALMQTFADQAAIASSAISTGMTETSRRRRGPKAPPSCSCRSC